MTFLAQFQSAGVDLHVGRDGGLILPGILPSELRKLAVDHRQDLIVEVLARDRRKADVMEHMDAIAMMWNLPHSSVEECLDDLREHVKRDGFAAMLQWLKTLREDIELSYKARKRG